MTSNVVPISRPSPTTDTSPECQSNSTADDLTYGADRIGDIIGMSAKQIYYLADPHRLKRNRMPIIRIGSRLCARRSKLLAWLEAREREAAGEDA